MIRIEHVWKRYDDLIAVRDLTLSIKEGEICVFLGPSGCGKSTTIRMINKLILPTEGKIYLQGQDIDAYPVEKLRQGIGYVVQSTGLFPHFTVEENIGTVPKLLKWDKKRIEARTRELLEMVGLNVDQYLRKYPSELSGGEAQRVGVARALAADPPVVLMDEPFGAVDPLNRTRLQNEFLKIQKELKKTVVFVTHDVEEAIKMGDKIAIMENGVLQDCDTPEGLVVRSKNNFVRTFLGKEYALKILAKRTVGEIRRPADACAARPYCVSERDSLLAAISCMVENGVGELAVQGPEGEVCGMVTISDVLHVLRSGDECHAGK